MSIQYCSLNASLFHKELFIFFFKIIMYIFTYFSLLGSYNRDCNEEEHKNRISAIKCPVSTLDLNRNGMGRSDSRTKILAKTFQKYHLPVYYCGSLCLPVISITMAGNWRPGFILPCCSFLYLLYFSFFTIPDFALLYFTTRPQVVCSVK